MILSAMYKYIFLAALPLFAQMQQANMGDKKIVFQNTIVAKVNGNTISMMDVKKKLDMHFHQHYPHLADSSTARHQFYEKSWRQIMMEMIDNQLILADAEAHQIKTSDADVRQTMEERFGPNTLETLEKIGLTYDEAFKLVKNEIIVQRMSWFFIQAKAFHAVTPLSIKKAYQSYLEEHPPYNELKYRVVTIQSQNLEVTANLVYNHLIQNKKSPELLESSLKEIDPSIQISSEYTASDLEISETLRNTLHTLLPESYSEPAIQTSRAANKKVARIYYLASLTDHPASTFQELSQTLRDQLLQTAMAKESTTYLNKLRNNFGFDTAYLKETVPDDMHPFSLQ